MIPFKKKDRIEHPIYGEGVIKKITPVSQTLSLLLVYFQSGGFEKELNSQWVEQHCRHQRYVSEDAPVLKDGVYTENAALSDARWRVFPEQDVELTDALLAGWRYVLNNVTPGINLALIDQYAVVVLDLEEGATDKEIEKTARKHMTGMLRRHPDFGCILLDDGGLVITMYRECLWQFVPPADVSRDADGKISLKTMLTARAALMYACATGNLSAIVRGAPEESTQA